MVLLPVLDKLLGLYVARAFGCVLTAVILTVAGARAAEGPPHAVATIAPVHSLLAMVMGNRGQATLLLPPNTSPHHFSMKPSQARALANAEIVFQVSKALERFLERPLKNLARDATIVVLADAADVNRLPFRNHPDDDHDGADIDPHMWLDPGNGRVWLSVMARALGRLDPQYANQYAQNAEAARHQLTKLQAEIQLSLQPLKGKPFVLFHDGFQYFEQRFALPAVGTLALSDARPPGARQIAKIHRLIETLGVICIFGEPQFQSGQVKNIVNNSKIRLGVLDPIGTTLSPGADLYPQLMWDLTNSLKNCLSP